MPKQPQEPQSSVPSAGSGHVFARDSTGLVRDVGPISSAIYNLSYSSAPFALALLLVMAPAFYLGANVYLAIGLTLLLALPTALVFAMLTTAIPRSGGDYTWISRSISPMLGFASNFSYMLWATFIIGVIATLVPSVALAPLFRWMSANWDWSGALSISEFLSGKAGTLIVGLVLVALGASVLLFSRGLRSYIRFQNWIFAYWFVILLIAVPIIVFLATKGGFISNFNEYALKLGGVAGASSAVTSGSIPDPGFSLKETILVMTIPYYAIGFIYQSAYFAGEMKRGGKGVLISMPGAQLLTVLVLMLGAAAFFTTPGHDFLAGLSLNAGSFGLDPAPQYPELAAIASGSPIVGVLILLASVLFYVIFIPISMIMISRSLFAWSFDRLIPEKVSEVNTRTHSPINAVLVIVAFCVATVILVTLKPDLGALVVLLGQTLTFICVGIAAMAFPYSQPDVFESSPFRSRIRGVPLLSILGAVSTVCMTGMFAILMLDPNSGTAWSTNPGRVLVVAGIFIGGLVLYQVIRFIQRSRGVNIDLAYQEIPPE